MQSRIRPDLPAADRVALIAAGLLQTERRGRATHVLATDAAWAWANAHLGVALASSSAASPILRAVLSQLGPFLTQRGFVLADLMLDADLSGPHASESVPPSAAGRAHPKPPSCALPSPLQSPSGVPLRPLAKVQRRVCDAVLGLGGGRSKQRVRLAELRVRLPEVSRPELDAVLLLLQSERQLVLYRLDNPAELRPADHEAALLVGGNPRHLVYMEG